MGSRLYFFTIPQLGQSIFAQSRRVWRWVSPLFPVCANVTCIRVSVPVFLGPEGVHIHIHIYAFLVQLFTWPPSFCGFWIHFWLFWWAPSGPRKYHTMVFVGQGGSARGVFFGTKKGTTRRGPQSRTLAPCPSWHHAPFSQRCVVRAVRACCLPDLPTMQKRKRIFGVCACPKYCHWCLHSLRKKDHFYRIGLVPLAPDSVNNGPLPGKGPCKPRTFKGGPSSAARIFGTFTTLSGPSFNPEK